MDWFEMRVGFHGDEKVLALREAVKNREADAFVSRIYAHCYLQEQARFASSRAPAILERAAEWRGKTGHLVAALIEVGFLDRDGDDLVVHGVEARLAKMRTFRERATERKEKWKREHSPATVPEQSPEHVRNAFRTRSEHEGNDGPTNRPTDRPITTTDAVASDAAGEGLQLAALEAPPQPKRKRPGDEALEALEAELSAAYREAKGEELDWPKSAHGELQAIRKSLADDAEVARRWRLFLADAYWPIKNVHKFRDAYQHAKFQRANGAAEPPKRYPSIPVFK